MNKKLLAGAAALMLTMGALTIVSGADGETNSAPADSTAATDSTAASTDSTEASATDSTVSATDSEETSSVEATSSEETSSVEATSSEETSSVETTSSEVDSSAVDSSAVDSSAVDSSDVDSSSTDSTTSSDADSSSAADDSSSTADPITPAPTTLGAVKAKQTGATDKTVTLAFEDVEGAAEYQVISGGKVVASVKADAAKKEVKIDGLRANIKKKYRVVAADAAGVLGKAKIYTVYTAPAQTTGVKASTSKKNTVLTWKKTKGADGYKVYATKPGKKSGYKCIKVVHGNKFTVKNAKKNVSYKVKAFKRINKVACYGPASKAVVK